MEIIFTVIGLIVLGFFVRAIFGDEKMDMDKNNWIGQLLFCLLIGGVIWLCLPKSCNDRSDDREPGRMSQLF